MNVSYTAVVLRPDSKAELLKLFPAPEGWEVKAHHMTINLGSRANSPAKDLIGQEVQLKVIALGQDDKVMAVKVETIVPCDSSTIHKHVTIAVNRAAGGKPVQSGKLTDWKTVPTFLIHGFVAECGVGDVIISSSPLA